MNYREKIRKAIECPQFGNTNYGEVWNIDDVEMEVIGNIYEVKK